MKRLIAGLFCLVFLPTVSMLAAEEPAIRAMPASEVSSSGSSSLRPLGDFPTSSADSWQSEADRRARPAAFENPMTLDSGEPMDAVPMMVGPAGDYWSWQIVPAGLMFRPYLAGVREPRMGLQLFHEPKSGWLWDAAVGAQVGIIRYGTDDPIWPEGWQFDIEGAAFPRLTADEDGDLVSSDFRYGCGLTHRRGRLESKFSFYHLSSHLGDEYELSHPWLDRINFSRFGFVLAAAVYPIDNLRVYAEAGWAFYTDGGSEPWEFQFGAEYSPLNPSGPCGAPFAAVNAHLRQEVDFGGNLTLETGWQWRGATGRLARVGFFYLNGQSDQYQFYQEHEQQVGAGFWYDF